MFKKYTHSGKFGSHLEPSLKAMHRALTNLPHEAQNRSVTDLLGMFARIKGALVALALILVSGPPHQKQVLIHRNLVSCLSECPEKVQKTGRRMGTAPLQLKRCDLFPASQRSGETSMSDAASFTGVFLPPFVRILATPSKRNPSLRGGPSFVPESWQKTTPLNSVSPRLKQTRQAFGTSDGAARDLSGARILDVPEGGEEISSDQLAPEPKHAEERERMQGYGGSNAQYASKASFGDPLFMLCSVRQSDTFSFCIAWLPRYRAWNFEF